MFSATIHENQSGGWKIQMTKVGSFYFPFAYF